MNKTTISKLVLWSSALALGVIMAGVSFQSSAAPMTFYGCFSKFGIIVKVNTNGPPRCGRKQPIEWNSEGPQGLPGAVPASCPCRYDNIPNTQQAGHWSVSGIDDVYQEFMDDTQTTPLDSYVCELSNGTPGSFVTQMLVDVQLSRPPPFQYTCNYRTDGKVQAIHDGLSEAEAFACGRDINAYAQALINANSISVTDLGTCPE